MLMHFSTNSLLARPGSPPNNVTIELLCTLLALSSTSLSSRGPSPWSCLFYTAQYLQCQLHSLVSINANSLLVSDSNIGIHHLPLNLIVCKSAALDLAYAWLQYRREIKILNSVDVEHWLHVELVVALAVVHISIAVDIHIVSSGFAMPALVVVWRSLHLQLATST